MPPKGRILDTSCTRYHVVRAAALERGWHCVEGEEDGDIPALFHGYPCREDGDSQQRLPLESRTMRWQDKSLTPASRTALGSPQLYVNHFIGMDVISRKAVLFRRLMKVINGKDKKQPRQQRTPQATGSTEGLDWEVEMREVLTSCFPQSFCTDTDYSALEAHWKSCQEHESTTYYIIKPNKGCEGKGIRVTSRPLEAITAEERQRQHQCLVQVYIDRPLLIEGKKFDLRLYVLLSSVALTKPETRNRFNPTKSQEAAIPDALPSRSRTSSAAEHPVHGVHLYTYEEGLVRVCADSYESPNEMNCGRKGVHLTNFAVNKHLDCFAVTATDLESGDGGNKRTLRFLKGFINDLPEEELDAAAMARLRERHGGCSQLRSRWEAVQAAIDECIVLTVLSGAARLLGEQRSARLPPDSSFELLGFDIMLTSDTLQPVLMEVNHSPSLFCETGFDFELKRHVVGDTLTLVHSRGAERGRWRRLLPVPQQREEVERNGEAAGEWSETQRRMHIAMYEAGASVV